MSSIVFAFVFVFVFVIVFSVVFVEPFPSRCSSLPLFLLPHSPASPSPSHASPEKYKHLDLTETFE